MRAVSRRWAGSSSCTDPKSKETSMWRYFLRSRQPGGAWRLVILATLFAGSDALATSGGNPYEVPDAVDNNSDPNIFETTILADETDVIINGVTVHAETFGRLVGGGFEGTIPGPTIRVKVGD